MSVYWLDCCDEPDHYIPDFYWDTHLDDSDAEWKWHCRNCDAVWSEDEYDRAAAHDEELEEAEKAQFETGLRETFGEVKGEPV